MPILVLSGHFSYSSMYMTQVLYNNKRLQFHSFLKLKIYNKFILRESEKDLIKQIQ